MQVMTSGVGSRTNKEIKKYLRSRFFKSAYSILQEGADTEIKVFKVN